jgi:hypothetical protein
MKTQEAKDIIGGLTYTSKMPCPSISIPSHACKTGSKLVKIKGSTCEGCYTFGGMYNFPAGKLARDKRLDSLYDPRWVEAMVTLIKSRKAYKKGTDWFRWHDSGDIQGMIHLCNIMQVAELTPDCDHWLPTRENEFLSAYVESGKVVPSNMFVRVSALMIDGLPPSSFAKRLNDKHNVKGFIGTSTVHKDKVAIGVSCIAYTQGGECKDCRTCWSTELNVSYPKH